MRVLLTLGMLVAVGGCDLCSIINKVALAGLEGAGATAGSYLTTTLAGLIPSINNIGN